LVIKVNNPTEHEIAMIRAMVSDHHNVYFITKTLTRNQVNELIYCVDTVVSLHRAEGFGLVLAEAMMLGTPTIATDWSSNTEFMNSDVACMVKAKLVEIREDTGVFKKGNLWADPDIDQAAMYMKRLYEDEIYGTELTQKAKVYIAEHLGMQRAAEQIRTRVEAIYKET